MASKNYGVKIFNNNNRMYMFQTSTGVKEIDDNINDIDIIEDD